MTGQSFNQFLEFIGNLPALTAITYYFAVYVFIGLLQKILHMQINTFDKFRASILASFVLIHLFLLLLGFLPDLYQADTFVEQIVFTAASFLIGLLFIENIVFSDFGILNQLNRRTFSTARENRHSLAITQLEDSKIRRRDVNFVLVDNTLRSSNKKKQLYEATRPRYIRSAFHTYICVVLIIFLLQSEFSVITIVSSVSLCLVWLALDLKDLIIFIGGSATDAAQELWGVESIQKTGELPDLHRD